MYQERSKCQCPMGVEHGHGADFEVFVLHKVESLSCFVPRQFIFLCGANYHKYQLSFSLNLWNLFIVYFLCMVAYS